MAVHGEKNQGKNRTIRHSRAYCTCVDGNRCAEQASPPKKIVRDKNLARRIKGYESSGGGKSATKSTHFRHKPGSSKNQRGYIK